MVHLTNLLLSGVPTTEAEVNPNATTLPVVFQMTVGSPGQHSENHFEESSILSNDNPCLSRHPSNSLLLVSDPSQYPHNIRLDQLCSQQVIIQGSCGCWSGGVEVSTGEEDVVVLVIIAAPALESIRWLESTACGFRGSDSAESYGDQLDYKNQHLEVDSVGSYDLYLDDYRGYADYGEYSDVSLQSDRGSYHEEDPSVEVEEVPHRDLPSPSDATGSENDEPPAPKAPPRAHHPEQARCLSVCYAGMDFEDTVMS
ncbi:hypothetical protein P4O66_001816 [Electrophorus voltai]|uniref:Uncharacterized protein n=1 Tax=Electrophorus voltai TaxID=2609070 RepID=A0AAD8Z641_9TELE|nr:hypothetical protein P4O66_001816 [Electrophorus voltai]